MYNNGLLEPGKVEALVIMIRVEIYVITNKDIYGISMVFIECYEGI